VQEAIALTWSTLTARLKNLRAGAACAGACLLFLILAAAIWRSGWVLAGLPALMILGFAFFRRDADLLFRWEDRILAAWGASDLCMGILAQTFREHPGPLKATLKGMIANLPPNPDYLTPPPDVLKAERALFWARSTAQRIRLERAAALNLALSSVPWLAWMCVRQDARLLPLAAIPLALVLPARAVLASLGRSRLRARLKSLEPWDRSKAGDLEARWRALDGSGALPFP